TTKETLPIENGEVLKSFFDKNKIDYCINCAAYTAVDKAEIEKEKAFLINADAVRELAAVCLNHQTKFIHISTDYVYDGSVHNPLQEENEINVINDQFGSPTYAADLAGVIMKLIEETEQGKSFSGIVNYSNSGVTTWYEFAQEIKSLVNSNCKINPIPSSAYPTPAKRPLYSVLDTSKI